MREQLLYAEYGIKAVKLESASADFIASLLKLGIEDIDSNEFEALILAHQKGHCCFDIQDSIGHYLRSIYKMVSYTPHRNKNRELVDTITKYSVFFDKMIAEYDSIFEKKHYFLPRPLFNSDDAGIDDMFLDDCPMIPLDFFSVSEYYAACNILNLVGIINMWYMPLLDIVLDSRFTKYREYYHVSAEVNWLLRLG